MSTWLYQLIQKVWTTEIFRFEIWEGRHWHWTYGLKRGESEPAVGDTVVFFYSATGGDDPGVYGWAVLERHDPESKTLYFVPAAPTNRLKMDPWWGDEAKQVTDDIRGPMKQAMLFEVSREDTLRIRAGIRHWLACRT